MEEYLPHVHRKMIFIYESMDDKWKWTNFFMNVGNIFSVAKNWTKEKGWKFFMLVYFENFDTWNAEIIFQSYFILA
jgi:hypothetical protein